MILSQLTRLISVPPGDLVYHLVVLFAVEAILLLALSEGRHSNWSGGALRVTIASTSLLILQGAQVIVALLSAAGAANSMWIMPPLERFVSVVSLGLLAWAFLPWMEDYPQVALVLVLANSVGAVIVYAILGPQWYSEAQAAETFYNAGQANWTWGVWAATLALLASVTAMLRRRAQWGTLTAVFVLLLLGQLLHVIYGDPQAHVAGWVRLSELCAYPLLVGVMLLRATGQEEATAPRLAPSSAAPTPWATIEACQRVAEASNATVAVQRAGMAMSNLLGTDILAIGLLNKSNDSIDLAAVCRAGAAPRSGPTFDVASQLPIQSAINRKRASMVDVDQEAQRATLAALIGGAKGPLWVQPLVHQHVAVGVLVAGRFTQHKTFAWTADEIETLDGLCSVMASAISAAQTSATLAHQVDQLQQQTRNQQATLAQAEIKAQQLSTQLAQMEAQRKRTPMPVPARSDRLVETTAATRKDRVEDTRVPPAGETTLRVRVKLDGNTPLKSARAMMVLAHIKRVGRIIACQPVEADLRSGGFEDEFTVTFTTSTDPAAVRSALIAIRDVVSVDAQAI